MVQPDVLTRKLDRLGGFFSRALGQIGNHSPKKRSAIKSCILVCTANKAKKMVDMQRLWFFACNFKTISCNVEPVRSWFINPMNTIQKLLSITNIHKPYKHWSCVNPNWAILFTGAPLPCHCRWRISLPIRKVLQGRTHPLHLHLHPQSSHSNLMELAIYQVWRHTNH